MGNNCRTFLITAQTAGLGVSGLRCDGRIAPCRGVADAEGRPLTSRNSTSGNRILQSAAQEALTRLGHSRVMQVSEVELKGD